MNTNYSKIDKACFLAGFVFFFSLLTAIVLFPQVVQAKTRAIVFDKSVEFRRNYLYHLSLVLPEHLLSRTRFEFGRTTGEFGGVDLKSSKFEVKQEIRTGISDKLEINLNLGYLATEMQETRGLELKRSGLRNISFGFTYRMLEIDADTNNNFDLVTTFTPDIENAELATPTNKGNAFSGRTEFSLEGVFGRREQKTEFSLHLLGALLGRETVVNKDSGLSQRSDISYRAEFFMVFQPRLKRGHYLEAKAGLRKLGDRKIGNTAEKIDPSFFGAVSYTYKFLPEWALGAEFNWFERNGKEYRQTSGDINQHIYTAGINVVKLFY